MAPHVMSHFGTFWGRLLPETDVAHIALVGPTLRMGREEQGKAARVRGRRGQMRMHARAIHGT